MTTLLSTPAAADSAAAWLLGHGDAARAQTRNWPTGRHVWPGMGIEYEAVRMPAPLVHAAVHSTDPPSVAERLTRFLEGPMAAAPAAGWYLALTRPTGPKWYKRCDPDGLGTFVPPDEHLILPHPSRTTPSSALFWSRPVQPGQVSEALSVALLLDMGDHALSWRARYCDARGEATYAPFGALRILVGNQGTPS
ncbi:hypothetical protein ACIP93_10055 [Streptomyces sp. NPDC088745]|uniref:hypothetical protein n=1 Tax=Streptomyces sp. NPDC088745 TaxID=3365884 RepID=UPI003811B87D